MRESGKPTTQVARELGIRRELIRNWKQQFEGRSDAAHASSSPGALSTEQEEIRRLKRENEVLRQEREFLKKAAAYFAKESR